MRRAIIKVATPLLYLRKKQNDDKFFRRIELKRQGILVPTKRKIFGIKRLLDPIAHMSENIIHVLRNKLYRRVVSIATIALLCHHSVSILLLNYDGGGGIINRNYVQRQKGQIEEMKERKLELR